MTKKEIARSISEDLGLTQLQAKQIVQKLFDAIVQTLAEEGRVELRNFGVFQVKRRGPRKARNPKTGETIFVPEKSVVTFKPGQVVQQRVEALGPQRRHRRSDWPDDVLPGILKSCRRTKPCGAASQRASPLCPGP